MGKLFFAKEKTAVEIENEVNAMDKGIDVMVYELYG